MDGLRYFAFSCLSFSLLAVIFGARLSQDEIDLVVSKHNSIRNKAALGLVPQHPSGGDLLFMTWDDEIAHTAEMEIRDLLNGGEHDPEMLGDDNIGHVEAKNMPIEESIDSWYRGLYSHLYDDGCIPGDANCLAFAQIVQSDVSKVGCAISRKEGLPKIFLCHYKPQLQNFGAKPYMKGSPKIECPDDYGFQRATMPGLCASKENCEEQKTNGCMCRINRCENDGIFNSDLCSCECPTSYGGLGCQNCEMSGCQNGGLFNQTSCSCLCADGYTGNQCEIVVMDIKEEDLVLSSGMGSGEDKDWETLEEFDSTCFKHKQGSIYSESFLSGGSNSLEFSNSPSSAPSRLRINSLGATIQIDATVDGGMVSNDVAKSKCAEDGSYMYVKWKNFAQPQKLTARTTHQINIARGRPTCVRFYYMIFGDDPGELLVSFEMYKNDGDLTVVEDTMMYQLTGRSMNKPTWVSQEIDLTNEMDFMFMEFTAKNGNSGISAVDEIIMFEKSCKDVPN